MRRLLLLIPLLLPPAFAHDLELTAQPAGAAVLVRARYGASEPAAFVRISVYAPSAPKSEFQSGNADRNGVFSFVPDARGAWRVAADDEMGHRVETVVAVNETGAAASAAAAPVFWRGLAGASLILALTGLYYGWSARRARRGG